MKTHKGISKRFKKSNPKKGKFKLTHQSKGRGSRHLKISKIMPEEEKFGLMSAIANGKVKVKNKADISRPLQFIPRAQEPKKAASADKIDDDYSKSVNRDSEKQKSKDAMNTREYDQKIESIDFSDSVCPALGTQLLYLLKYGEGDA